MYEGHETYRRISQLRLACSYSFILFYCFMGSARLKTLAALGLASIMLAVAGCGNAAPIEFQVTGAVTFQDKPVTEGTVTFEDNNTGFAQVFEIGPDGTYSANVPAGDYSLSIQPPMIMIADSAQSEGGAEFKKVDNIPNRYWSAFQSGMDVSVSEDTKFDVSMVKGRR